MKKYEKILESLRLKRELNDKYCEQNSCLPTPYMVGSNLILDELIKEIESMKEVKQTENSKSLEHKSGTIEAYEVEDRGHKKKMDRVQFFVEATDEERYFLWKENDERGTDDEFGNNKVEWIEDSMGFMQLVGTIMSGKTKLPVYVSLSFAQIGGKYICFYYGCSRGTDHDMIEKFIEKYPVKWDGGTRRAMTDAMNFHHCLDFVTNEDRS